MPDLTEQQAPDAQSDTAAAGQSSRAATEQPLIQIEGLYKLFGDKQVNLKMRYWPRRVIRWG